MWSTARRVRGALGATLDDFTEHWIGWAFPPAMRAIADVGWLPDDPADYCQRCGDGVGPGEQTTEGCASCRTGGSTAGGVGDGVIRLGPYVDPLRTWVRAIKYHGWQEMAEVLGRELANALNRSGTVDLSRAAVVPMPMSWQRRMFRGIDHAHVLAHAMARELELPLVRMLTRSNQPPQVRLTPSERRRSGSRGMRMARRWGAAAWDARDLHLVVVDDVKTTGATLRAATRILRRSRPERIICCVLAVSDSAARQMRRQDSARGDASGGNQS